ncbi:MAG: hypothetical protein A2052_08375 [Deltaproteobacteria bacterium GWA2_54_12]|nr:MAG: hypothetical protein A2052_08375 [Deltaproteobacteria bacterium GWA2_54_12]
MMNGQKNLLLKIAVPLLLAAFALAFISPVLQNIHNVGVSEWDSRFFYHAVPLRTIMEFGQFPLWNPYYCGGNAMLAAPESNFLAPSFILALLFGEVVGVKLIIALYAVLGFLGMYLLSRVLGMARLSSLVPSVIFMMSSWFALRISEGHSSFLPFALLPFVVAMYIKSFSERNWWRWAALSSLFYAWMIFAGGVYPFTVTSIFLGFFCLLSMIRARSFKPALMLAAIVAMAFFLSAVKAIPQYEFMNSFPRKTEAVEYNSIELLGKSLFSRNQRVTTQDPDFYLNAFESKEEHNKAFWSGAKPWGWHEYGAFTGVAAFVLFIGSVAAIRRSWPWLVISITTLLMSLGEFSPVDIWSILHRLPVVSSLHGSSRVMPLFIFTFAIAAGFALSRAEEAIEKRWKKAGVLLAGVAVAVVFVEMFTVSRPVLKDAFNEPPPKAVKNEAFRQLVVKEPTKVNYSSFLSNIGVLNCYDTMRPPIKAVPYGNDEGRKNPGYMGEAFFASGKGKATVTYFSPNLVLVDAVPIGKDTLVLNQNYFKGWKANNKDAVDHWGLVGTPVDAGKKQVAFRYSPRSFKIGLVISIISTLFVGWLIIRPCRRYPTF